MEQRLRLVQGGQPRAEKRAADRRRIAVPGQIVWKDAKGTTRMAAVVTRDVSDNGVSVDCLGRHADSTLSPGVFPGGPRGAEPAGPSRRTAEVERAVGGLPRWSVPSGDGRAKRVRAADAGRARACCANRHGRQRGHAHVDGLVAAGPPLPGARGSHCPRLPAVRPIHGRFRRPSIPRPTCLR